MRREELRTAELLRRYGDPACYEDMLQTIARGQAEILEATALGVLMRHTRAGLYMLAGDAQRMSALAGQIPAEAKDVLIHGAMPPQEVHRLRQRFGCANALPFVVYAYYGDCPPQEDSVDIRPLGMDALVETRSGEEIARAVAAGADIIGVNSRDLETLAVDIAVSERLLKEIPDGIVKVAESGIRNRQDIRTLEEIGADAVLIGELLMRAEDKMEKLKELKGQ